ncbi:MAG: hypothetical protein ACJ8D8_06325 [Microvirga sp.]
MQSVDEIAPGMAQEGAVSAVERALFVLAPAPGDSAGRAFAGVERGTVETRRSV